MTGIISNIAPECVSAETEATLFDSFKEDNLKELPDEVLSDTTKNISTMMVHTKKPLQLAKAIDNLLNSIKNDIKISFPKLIASVESVKFPTTSSRRLSASDNCIKLNISKPKPLHNLYKFNNNR